VIVDAYLGLNVYDIWLLFFNMRKIVVVVTIP
jgi:hypothetical protein